MSLQDQFERILGRLHEAALGDVQWTVPASMINEFIRTHASNLVIYEGRSPADAAFSLVRSCYGSRRRRDLEERYDSTDRGGGWSSTQTRMIERLLPHVRQFARVRGVLADAGGLGSSLGELLDNGRSSVIQLDRRARIVAANDRARGLLRQDGGLSDRGGFLNASTPRENDALQRLLARALSPLYVQASAGSMSIGRTTSRTRLVVHITPVNQREGDVRAQRVAALVLVVDPERRPRINAGLVAQALDLTPAESRVAAMVAAGRPVQDIATMTGRTEGTVRWHLKKIFRKQGISRQADLVRLVLSLDGFPVLRPPQRSRRQPGGVTGDIRGSVPESRGEGR